MDNAIVITVVLVALWGASYVYNLYVAIYETRTFLEYDGTGIAITGQGRVSIGILSIAYDVAIIIFLGPIVTPLYVIKHVLCYRKRRRFL